MNDEAASLSVFERMLLLRAEPCFRDLPPAELTAVAELAHERRFARGEYLLRQGELSGAAYVLAEGQARVLHGGRVETTLGPKDPLGLFNLLARTAERVDVIAEDRVLALELDADSITDLLEDHFSILVHLVRCLARSLSDAGRIGENDEKSPSFCATSAPLGLLERITLLSRFPLVRASYAALAELAESLEELRPKEGEVLWRRGDPAPFMVLVAQGGVRCEAEHDSFVVGPNGIAGALDALANLPRSRTAIAEANTLLLRMDAELIFDLSEDHPEILLEVLAMFARSVAG